MRIRNLLAAAAAVALVGTATASDTAADTDLFKGRNITLLIGFGPGGGYDTYSRLLARHYGRHVPGNPEVVAQNMPGAGGMIVANRLYNTSPKDGTELGIIAASTALEPLFGSEEAKFETTKFTWIGSMNREVASCAVWHTTGVTSLDDLMEQEVTFGATGPAAITSQHPRILANVLDAQTRVIHGYQGTKEINLAMHRGEVGGTCGMFVSSLKASYWDDFQRGDLVVIVQFGLGENHPDLGDVPNVFDYAETEEQRQVLEIHFGQTILGRPLAGAPGIPEDRAQALRTSFTATMKDPEVLAEAEKIGLEINPVDGDEAQSLLERFFSYSPEVIEQAKAAVDR